VELVIKEAVIKGDIDNIETLIKNSLANGAEPDELLKELISGMEVVGEKFEKKEYYVPETLLSAYAMQKGLDILKPLLKYKKSQATGRVVIGTVEGDVHDIGKNLVAMFLEGAGFEVYNLGRDVPASKFVEKAKEVDADIVGLSAMMTTTVEEMRRVIKEFDKQGMRNGIAFIIGGAATTEEFAREIGADGYGMDARKAILLCEKIMREKNELAGKI
jgi:5-methyltetrahydrofolate--homocysteine methyltransferase